VSSEEVEEKLEVRVRRPSIGSPATVCTYSGEVTGRGWAAHHAEMLGGRTVTMQTVEATSV
jgi:hypothetical protein